MRAICGRYRYSMKMLVLRTAFGVFLMLQLVWLVTPDVGTWGPGIDWYRRRERMAALKALGEHPSPATKLAFEEEIQRDFNYRATKVYAAMASALVVDGITVYCLWRYSGRKRAA